MEKYLKQGKLFLISISLATILGACGGGYSEDSNSEYNPAWVTVDNPETYPFSTQLESKSIRGSAFISDSWFICCTGSATDTGVTVTWRNLATGSNGPTVQNAEYCWFFQYYLCGHNWNVSITLALGENRIIFTAYDPDYSNTTAITVIREL